MVVSSRLEDGFPVVAKQHVWLSGLVLVLVGWHAGGGVVGGMVRWGWGCVVVGRWVVGVINPWLVCAAGSAAAALAAAAAAAAVSVWNLARHKAGM